MTGEDDDALVRRVISVLEQLGIDVQAKNPYMCPICEVKGFAYPESLAAHLAREHPSTRIGILAFPQEVSGG